MANISHEQLMAGMTSAEKVTVNAVLLWGVGPENEDGTVRPHAAKYPKESLQNFETAVAFVREYGFEYAEKVTGAQGSIETAVDGINKQFALTGDKKSDYSQHKFQGSDADYDKIIEILAGIHDKWVVDNAAKYDRDKDKKDKRLFQHMATELIGLDELLFDLAFVAPYLESMGFEAGEICKTSWGNGFKASPQIKAAYDRYVEKKLANINTKEELEEYIDRMINGGFDPLQGTDETSIARRAYMNSKKELLLEQAQAKKPQLAALENASQPE